MRKDYDLENYDDCESADDYEYKLRILKNKLTKSKKPLYCDNDCDEEWDGSVIEYPLTTNDESEYMRNKNSRKAFRNKELLLKKLREKFKIDEKCETFSEMLFRLIEEKRLKPSDCYKRANIDRRLLYKIKKNKYYMPLKDTVLAFSIALKLSLIETEIFLKSAGYAFCNNRITDVIVTEFIKRGRYSVDKINEYLYNWGQPLLGSDK